ncbi:MAG: hypothetical protein KatS3mg033_0206 [Thermonema sp.]|jgi:hypothetical protein|uniref:hypothetical protein n=1 Tax=Thermonema TaxID=28194 RepID=UPI00056DFE80|nr:MULTISPECIES: hypothetical protein [Thermonema]GIV38406.1 MAG: hypothetical protein KatS3mg033_0206 [Thermonema sp.]
MKVKLFFAAIAFFALFFVSKSAVHSSNEGHELAAGTCTVKIVVKENGKKKKAKCTASTCSEAASCASQILE